MGLTVHYTFHAPAASHAEAQELVAQLHHFASESNFPGLSELFQYDDENRDPFPIEFPVVEGRDLQLVPQIPVAWFYFGFPGADPVMVGLAKLDLSEADDLPLMIRKKLGKGYHFAAFCKTQFALIAPEGNRETFLAAHKAVIAMLDKARALGTEVEVRDESEYWSHRDEAKLLAYAERLCGFIAAAAGFLKDKNLHVTSPLLGSPDFEKMEARGRQEIEKMESMSEEEQF